MTGRIRRLAAVAALTLLPVTGTGTAHAAGPVASMGPGLNLKAGPHHMISTTLHAGWWTLGGRNGICISYNRKAPDGSWAALSRPLPTPSPEADAELKTAANLTTGVDATSGAVLWFAAAHILVDDPAATSPDAAALRADLPGYERQAPGIQARVKTLLRVAKVHAPYRVTVTLHGAIPGQQGSATATVTGSNGQPAAGRPIVWTVIGGTITSAGKATTSGGTAGVAYAATALAQTVTATVTTPSSTTVWVNRPSTGRQVVVGGGFMDRVSGSASAAFCPIKLRVVTDCACGGKAASSAYMFTSDGLPGSYAVTVTVNGTPVTQRLSGGNAQVTITVPYVRGQQVTASWSALDTAGRALVTGDLL